MFVETESFRWHTLEPGKLIFFFFSLLVCFFLYPGGVISHAGGKDRIRLLQLCSLFRFINHPYLTVGIYSYQTGYTVVTYFSLLSFFSPAHLCPPLSFLLLHLLSVTQISSHLSVQPHTSWQTALSLHCFVHWTTPLSQPPTHTHTHMHCLKWRPTYGNMEAFKNTTRVLVLDQICCQSVTLMFFAIQEKVRSVKIS